ncbi:GSCOCG00002569001-RA-CDS, partial [Cotesia congregata]
MLPFVVEGGASPPSTHTDIYSFSLSLTRPPALINEPSINKQTLGQKLNREIYLRQRLSQVSSRKNSDCKIIKSKNIQPVNFINLIMCGIFLMVTVILVPGISAAAAPDKIPIGAIFEQGTDEVQSAFKYAIAIHNQNNTTRRFDLQAYVDVINTADAFKLSRL